MVRTLIEQAVDGVILASSGLDGAGAKLLVQAGIPLVLLYNTPRQHDLDAFQVDNRGGFERVTRHLLRLGHRRIGFFRGPAAVVSLEREAGWRNAMAAAGFAVGAGDVAAFDFDQGGGYVGGMHLLGREPRPTALVCSSDLIALGALDAAADLGLSVPRDVAVTGFDDSYLAAMRRVRLTSLSYDYVALAQQAVSRLLQRLRGQRDDAPVRMTVPCEIVVRETCGAAMAGIGTSSATAGRPSAVSPTEA
jgi:LacI family transcriptional regulator